jgi:hypothetical protein
VGAKNTVRTTAAMSHDGASTIGAPAAWPITHPDVPWRGRRAVEGEVRESCITPA